MLFFNKQQISLSKFIWSVCVNLELHVSSSPWKFSKTTQKIRYSDQTWGMFIFVSTLAFYFPRTYNGGGKSYYKLRLFPSAAKFPLSPSISLS